MRCNSNRFKVMARALDLEYGLLYYFLPKLVL